MYSIEYFNSYLIMKLEHSLEEHVGHDFISKSFHLFGSGMRCNPKAIESIHWVLTGLHNSSQTHWLIIQGMETICYKQFISFVIKKKKQETWRKTVKLYRSMTKPTIMCQYSSHFIFNHHLLFSYLGIKGATCDMKGEYIIQEDCFFLQPTYPRV